MITNNKQEEYKKKGSTFKKKEIRHKKSRKIAKNKKYVFCKAKMAPTGDIIKIFKDKWGRPKITPRHESAIQVLLEEKYTPSQIRNGLSNLEKTGILTSRRKQIEEVGNTKFYFLKEFDNGEFTKKIDEKIEHSAYWIKRYSNEKILKMIGEHLHDLVRAELRAQNFEILREKNVREFNGKRWDKTDHSLDMIANHRKKDLTVGLEIKNALYPTPKSEVATKIEMCKTFGVVPVFAARWLETHRSFIDKSGGFLWQFKKQFYPRGQGQFVKTIQKRFKFPVTIAGSLPHSASKDIEEWISGF